jgi:hypothetical protein
MAIPIRINFEEIPAFELGVGMGINFSIPCTNYDPVGKLIEFRIEREDDPNLFYTTDSDAAYINAFPQVGDVAAYVSFAIPSSVLTAVAVIGKKTNYGIDFRPSAGADPTFRLQGDMLWTRPIGAPHD